jgi:phosphoglycerol transferase MdoB-like AlkP superfamily enzyme
LAGYEHFRSRKDFDEKDFNGSWGTWDHVTVAQLTADMDSMPEPFHVGLFNLCTHVPYNLPDYYKFPTLKAHRQQGIARTFTYYDDVLRNFFAREVTRERFHRTLYVFIGDHTGHAPEEERFRIGCIFYAPGRLTPRVDTTLCSQLNILPSILDLAGIETMHASFGASLFSKHPHADWAMTSWSNIFFWQQDHKVLETDLGSTLKLSEDLGIIQGWEPIPNENGTAELFRRRAQAIYQVTQLLTRENALVAPTKP